MQMKKNFINSSKSKAAILYIQPVEYEDEGVMTGGNLDPSPMKPTAMHFHTSGLYPMSRSIEEQSPCSKLMTSVELSPVNSDKRVTYRN